MRRTRGWGARSARGRFASAALLAAPALLASIWPPAACATAPYSPKRPPLTTPWTQSVSTSSPLPEYPRPQLERARWMSLNGRWQYAGGGGTLGAPPVGQALAQTILVPFAPESALSGIQREDLSGWYRRLFTVPAAWGSDHVMLNFGAVAWEASVYVNGRLAGTHRGDYDSFSLDITRFLRPNRPNELLLGFSDPVGASGEPVGKQVLGAPHGYFHTAVSGIWQTVWLEPVAAAHIGALELTPDLARHELLVAPALTGPRRGLVLAATAMDGNHAVASAHAPAGRRLVIHIPQPREWSPTTPFLYGLRVQLTRQGRAVDDVQSYFGMRSISLGRVGGATRILLNGRFVFQAGALDQGYWPDGLYTPSADEAMRFDIQSARRMGFDMLREHEKIQPDRWYYWADRLGLLVWQDMPSPSLAHRGLPSPAGQAEFRRELASVVAERESHPSIVAWVPFNEGWGAFDPSGVTTQIHRMAPGELVDTDSGSANCCNAPESAAGDLRDAHLYSGPFAVPPDRRASVIGEYGAVLPFPPGGHRWPGVLTSIGSPVLAWPEAPAIDLLRAQYADLAQEVRVRGLSGAVFTELANYEQELGILTYDRRVYTMNPTTIRGLNDALINASREVSALRPQAGAVPPGADGVWSFSEGSGGTSVDASGHGNDLILHGAGWGAGPALGGHASGALEVTGQGQSAQTTGTVVDTTRSFTVSVWLDAGVAGESGTAVSEPGPDGSSFSLGIQSAAASALRGPATWWTFVVPGSSHCDAAQCGVRANMRYDDGRFSPRPGSWHQLTAVYDTATATITLYVDGVPEDAEHVFGIPAAGGPLTVGEGSGDYGPSDFFQGRIALLRTYARALSPAEVWQLHEAQSTAG